MKEPRHTILLVQFPSPGNASNVSKSWTDYETVSGAMDGVCRLFEQKLKRTNPEARNIQYDISDLYKYIDELPDLSALVFNPATSTYSPCGKDWIKSRVFAHLRGLAA
mmetsp:Transcript_16/g.26  ORF Transcript_16/g.26 Transcript_16/m.26 type:complete len:108 (+) Transcript_16:166-489(+)